MVFKISINGSKKLPWPASSLQCGLVLSFQRKNQQITVGYMYLDRQLYIYFQNLGTGASFDSETYQKTQTRGSFILKIFPKKLELEILQFLEFKKLIWRLLTKSRNHTPQGLLFWFKLQFKSVQVMDQRAVFHKPLFLQGGGV
jgi:hypothetical protein